MGWLGHLFNRLFRALFGGFVELLSDCPCIDIFAGHVKLVDFALGPSALALVGGPIRVCEVRAEVLEIFLPWYPSRVKMEVMCKGLRVVMQPAASGPECAPPLQPPSNSESNCDDEKTTNWLVAYLQTWVPRQIGISISDATITLVDVFRQHHVAMAIPTLACDVNGLVKELQRLEVKGVFLEQSDATGPPIDLVLPFDLTVQLPAQTAGTASNPPQIPSARVTLSELSFNLVDDKFHHLIGLLDDIRSAIDWPCKVPTDNSDRLADIVTAQTSRAHTEPVQTADRLKPTAWELVFSCASIGISIDFGCRAPFQLNLLDNSAVVHIWPTIVNVDCRVMRMYCGLQETQHIPENSGVPWMILIASVEEECELLNLVDEGVHDEPLSHSRKVVSLEMTMTSTEFLMPTGCLACVIRNVPMLVNAFGTNKSYLPLPRRSTSWHLGKVSVDVPEVHFHLQASDVTLADAHVWIGPIVVVSHLQQVQGRIARVLLALQRSPTQEIQELAQLQEIAVVAHEVGSSACICRSAQSLAQLVAEHDELSAADWQAVIPKFHRWEVLFSVVAARSRFPAEAIVSIQQLAAQCSMARASPIDVPTRLEPIRTAPVLVGGQVFVVTVAVNSLEALICHEDHIAELTAPSFELQLTISPWARFVNFKSQPIAVRVGTAGQSERVMLSADVKEVLHATYLKQLHYSSKLRGGTVGVGFTTSGLRVALQHLEVTVGYHHAYHLAAIIQATEVRNAAPKPTPAADICHAAAPKPPKSRFRSERAAVDIAFIVVTLETAHKPAFSVSAADVHCRVLKRPGSMNCGGQLSNVLVLDQTDPSSNFNAVVSSAVHTPASTLAPAVNTLLWRYHDDESSADDGVTDDPILEVDAQALRVIYLNTTVLTMLTLVKDEILPALKQPHNDSGRRSTTLQTNRASAPAQRTLRIRAVLAYSEVHIPSSSYGADAIVMHFRRLAAWRQLPSWSAEYARNEQQLFWDCVCDSSDSSDGCPVSPPQRYCFAPFKLQTMQTLEGHVSSSNEYFAFDLAGASVGSWCSDNVIASDLSAQCKLEVSQLPREAYETMYGEVFAGLGFRPAASAVRARTTVAVLVDPVELVLTQGQYNAIWQMLIGNFAEPTKSLGRVPFQPSLTRYAYIGQQLRGSDPTALSALLADVPVYITHAKILTLDDSSQYEVCMNRDLDNCFEMSSTNAGVVEYRSVPRWSKHMQVATSQAADFDSPRVSEGSLLAVASNLVLQFFKKHDGCGTSFQVWARDICLVDPAMLPTELSLGSLRPEAISPGAYVLHHSDSLHRAQHDDGFVLPKRAQLLYQQQSVGPFRRILIDVAHSTLNARVDLINRALRFFTDPVFGRFDREQELFQHELGIRIESPTNLDLEVNSRRTTICLLEDIGPAPRAVCLNVDMRYTQMHRGFYRSGPGLLKYDFGLRCHSIYLALVGQIDNRSCISLVDPFACALSILKTTIPGKSFAEEYTQRWSPYLRFDDTLCQAVADSDRASCSQVTDIAITCSSLVNSELGSALEARMSYPDILLIRHAMTTLLGLSAADQPTRDNYYKRALQDFREIQNLPRGYKSTVHAPLLVPDIVPAEMRVVVECVDLNAVLRNNLVGFPVLRGCVLQPKFSMKQWSEGLQLAANMTIEAWQFNNATYSWEPFLEPVQLAAVSATEVADAVPHIHTELWASAININLFERLLLNPALRKLAFDVITSGSESLPPYTIENMVGQEITVVVSGRGRALKQTSLDAHETLALDYKTLMTDHAACSVQSMQRKGYRHALGIECEVQGLHYRSGIELSMDRPGTFHIVLHHTSAHLRSLKGSLPMVWKKAASSHNEPLLVVVEVAAGENGVKHIRIMSPLSVRNTTKEDVTVKFRRAEVDFGCEQTLLPNAVFHVPLELVAAETQLLVARANSNRWGQVLQTLGDVVSFSRPIFCACSADEDENDEARGLAWHVRIHADTESVNIFTGKDKYRGLHGSLHRHRSNGASHHNGAGKTLKRGHFLLKSGLPIVTLRLSPPIMLTSLLPQPIAYRISDSTSRVNGAGVVEIGESVHIHKLDLQQKLYLSIRVMNYCWSAWLKISSPNHLLPNTYKPSQLLLEPMNLEMSSSSQTHQKVSLPTLGMFVTATDSEIFVACPLWVDNRSGLDLEYKSATSARIDPLDDLLAIPHRSARNVVDWLQQHEGAMKNNSTMFARSRFPGSEAPSEASTPQVSTALKSSIIPVAGCPIRVRLPSNHCETVTVMMAPQDRLGALLEALVADGHLPESAANQNLEFRVPLRRNHGTTSQQQHADTDFKGRVPPNGEQLQRRNALPENVELGMGLAGTITADPNIMIERLETHVVCLYHPLEIAMYRQIQEAQQSATTEHGLFSSTTFYSAPFVPFEGAIPFYPPTLFGTHPSVAVRMPATAWSEAVDIQSETLTAGLGRHITLQDLRESKPADGTIVRRRCELGVHVHKGSGTLDKVTIMTLVPRFILVSKLSQPIQVAQVGMTSACTVHLTPGGVVPFHWTHADHPRMICVRIASPHHEEPQWQWSSECKLTNLGDAYIKIRPVDPFQPMLIIKAHVEMAGASLIATLSEEDMHWPPYRIDNFTPFALKYRQAGANERGMDKWDTVAPRTSVSYAWDFPVTSAKVLRVQFPQSSSTIERDFKLDELGKFRRIRLLRQLPVLDDPDSEGYLELRNTGFEDWKPYFCVLKHNALFMFKDHQNLQLMGVLSITTDLQSDTPNSSGHRVFASVHQVLAKSDRSPAGLLRKAAPAVFGHGPTKPLGTADIRRICVRLALQLEHDGNSADGNHGPTHQKPAHAPLHLRTLPINALLANLELWRATKPAILSVLLASELCEDMHHALSIFHQLKTSGVVTAVRVGRHSMHADEMLALLDSATGTTDVLSADTEPAQEQHEVVYGFQVPALDADVDESASTVFQLSTGNSEYIFRCGAHRFREWMIALRSTIEACYLPSSVDDNIATPELTMQALLTKTTITARLRADGPTKVLELAENMGDAGVNIPDDTETELEMTDMDDSNPTAAADTADATEITRSFSFRVEAIGLSLINSAPQELLYLSCRGVEADIEQEAGVKSFRLTVQQVQVDNQLPLGFLAVVLRPKVSAMLEAKHQALSLPGLSLAVGSLVPSLHFYGSQRTGISEGQRLLYFKACTLWVIPIEIRMEEELMALVLRLYDSLKRSRILFVLGADGTSSSTLSRSNNGNQIQEDKTEVMNEVFVVYKRYSDRERSRNMRMYFGSLHLHPLELSLTFKPSPDFHAHAAEEHLLSMAAQLNDARLCLNALLVDHAYGSVSYITDVIGKHYLVSFLKQLHHLIGSFDFLGSSVGLVANLGTGVRDFFYEPIDGLRNDRFLEGLGKGGKSLASHTVGGTMNAASKLAGTVGHGISLLSMDSDYQRERTRNRLREAQCMTDGLKFGVRELGQGLYAGVTGVVLAPYRGWKEEGGLGIGKGFVKGLVGVAVKPTVGIFDFASRATQGVRNFSRMDLDASDETYCDPRSRVRPPRVFGLNDALIPYDFDAAMAQTILDVLASNRETRMRLLTFLRIPSTGSTDTGGTGWATPVAPAESWALVASENVLLVSLSGDVENGMWTAHVLWICPLSEVQRAGTDMNGDIYLKLATAIDLHSAPLSIPAAATIIADTRYQDQYMFDCLLERTIGLPHKGRIPIVPTQESTLVHGKLWKKHVSGIRAILASSSEFLFFVSNHILYEYTRVADFTEPAAMMATCDTVQYQNDVYVMSYAFPLANVFVRDPYRDELGRICVDIACHGNAALLVVKRKANEQRLRMSSKGIVILTFSDAEKASGWADLLRYECVPAVEPLAGSQVLQKLWIPSHDCTEAERMAMVDNLAIAFPTTTGSQPDDATSTSSFQDV